MLLKFSNNCSIFLLTMFILTGCSLDFKIQPKDIFQSPDIKLGEVKVQPDIDTYSPIMSSTVGIGLTPLYTLGRSPETVKFYWKTNYGYFVSWQSPDFKVNKLGAETINNGEKIYWSYSTDEMGKTKPTVEISLTLKDTSFNSLLTTSNFKIYWESQDMAKVKK